MSDLPPIKTHLFLNHSPITQLVIQETLKLKSFQSLYSRILVVSTRGLHLNHPEIDEICYQEEQFNHSLEFMFQFFYDKPAVHWASAWGKAADHWADRWADHWGTRWHIGIYLG